MKKRQNRFSNTRLPIWKFQFLNITTWFIQK